MHGIHWDESVEILNRMLWCFSACIQPAGREFHHMKGLFIALPNELILQAA